MARMVAVKGSVSVQEVTFRDETAVDVAVAEVNGRLPVVLYMRDFFAGTFAQSTVEDQKLTVAENNAAFEEGGMLPGFAVEYSGHLREVSHREKLLMKEGG